MIVEETKSTESENFICDIKETVNYETMIPKLLINLTEYFFQEKQKKTKKNKKTKTKKPYILQHRLGQTIPVQYNVTRQGLKIREKKPNRKAYLRTKK